MNIEEMTIKQIRELIESGTMAIEDVEALRKDGRSSVNQLIKKWDRQQAEIVRVQNLYTFEAEFYHQEIHAIAGVDEAGRGPLAGPVVVAAVILPERLHIPKINDSKKLSAKVREELYQFIIEKAIAIERVFIEPEVIDKVNIYQATVQGMYEVIHALTPKAQAALIDAVPLNQLVVPSQSLIKGDAKSASIAAASIIAKVERDHLMDKLDKIYPEYGFASHKGYGTAAHLAAIRQYGPCPIHRKTFEPIKSWGQNHGNEYDG